jgi:hypothetical protein
VRARFELASHGATIVVGRDPELGHRKRDLDPLRPLLLQGRDRRLDRCPHLGIEARADNTPWESPAAARSRRAPRPPVRSVAGWFTARRTRAVRGPRSPAPAAPRPGTDRPNGPIWSRLDLRLRQAVSRHPAVRGLEPHRARHAPPAGGSSRRCPPERERPSPGDRGRRAPARAAGTHCRFQGIARREERRVLRRRVPSRTRRGRLSHDDGVLLAEAADDPSRRRAA